MELSPSTRLTGQRAYLSALRLSVPLTRLAADPALCELAAEDAAWNFERSAWHAARPERWQVAARRRWRSEGADQLARRDALRDHARSIGMPV